MSSTVRHAAVIAAICAICALPLPALALDSGADAPNAGGASWSFRVLLDGKPIGQHQFRATDGAGERTLVSEAAFSVRLLGVTLYQYQHRAVERWRGDCLLALSADTDDNGERTRVSARALGEQFEVTAPIPQTERGCVMSFAYWNPALRAQQRLLNSQTGEYRFCCNGVTYSGVGTVTVRGCTITLQHNTMDRRISATIDKSVFKGTASIQTPPGTLKCTITDRDTRNNSCTCP